MTLKLVVIPSERAARVEEPAVAFLRAETNETSII
jgi:hypothetical protein